MTIYATNGATLSIGAVLPAKSTDFVAGDFTPQTWVVIGEIEALGSIGDASAEITFDAISSQRTRRLKGTRNAGAMEIVCGIDPSDPGQIALRAAEKSPNDYAFRLVLNDAPAAGTANAGTPSERLFVAKVATATEAYDSANSVMKMNSTLWVNSNVVRIDAKPKP